MNYNGHTTRDIIEKAIKLPQCTGHLKDHKQEINKDIYYFTNDLVVEFTYTPQYVTIKYKDRDDNGSVLLKEWKKVSVEDIQGHVFSRRQRIRHRIGERMVYVGVTMAATTSRRTHTSLKKKRSLPPRVRIIKKISGLMSQDVVNKPVVLMGDGDIICAVSARHSVKLIYGRAQSGKTQETCEAMIQRMIVDKCPGIYVCRNFTKELDAQVESMSSFITKMNEDIEVVGVYDDSMQDEIAEAMKNGDSTKFYMVMGNDHLLKKVVGGLQDGDHVRYTVGIDEADMYVQKETQKEKKEDKEKTKTSESITAGMVKLLASGAISKHFISATLLDISSLIESTDYVEAYETKFAFKNEHEDEDRYYRALHSVTRFDLPNNNNHIDAAIDNGKQVLAQVNHDKLHTIYNNRGLPFLICHFHSQNNDPNATIASKMSKISYDGEQVVGLTFDQNGAQIYADGKVVDVANSLSSALTKLKKKKIVYLMGGMMCSRAFRVTSKDFEVYISAMIYNYGDASDPSLIVQRFGRMNGLTPQTLKCPQYAFSSAKNFNRALDVTNATTEMVMATMENPDDTFAVTLTKVVVPPRKGSKKIWLSKFNVEKDFRIDPLKESCHDIEAKEEKGEESILPMLPPGATLLTTLASSSGLAPQLTRAFNLVAAECERGVVCTRASLCTEEIITKYDFTNAGLCGHLTHMANKGVRSTTFNKGINFFKIDDKIEWNILYW